MAATGKFDKSSSRVYMLDIALPSDPPEEFFVRIPAQRTYINGLMEAGQVSSYSLASDRSHLWVTVHAGSEEEVADLIARFPLVGWMEVEIQELMFNETVASSLPPVSLN